MGNDNKNSYTSKNKTDGKKPPYHFRRRNLETKQEGVPTLRYRSTNNFHEFKEALSELAIKEYGHLCKLIEQGT
jgi:hypothetical protein